MRSTRLTTRLSGQGCHVRLLQHLSHGLFLQQQGRQLDRRWLHATFDLLCPLFLIPLASYRLSMIMSGWCMHAADL